MLGQTQLARSRWALPNGLGSALCSVAIAFGTLTVSACSNSYRPKNEVIPPAGRDPGTGATAAVGSGTAGTRGGRAGSSSVPPSGAGSDAPPPPDTSGSGNAGTGSIGPTFSAHLEGSSVIVDVSNWLAVFYLTCTDALTIEKLDAAGNWVPSIDHRPPYYNHSGYYLDSQYVPPQSNEGCDIISCQNFGSHHYVAKAAEYFDNGVVELTVNGMHTFAPSIETRPLTGTLLVRVRYSLGDPNCSTTQEVQLKLEVPPFDGVCCPVGSEGCNSTGPGGGWSLDSDSCPGFLPAYDAYYRRFVDPHGCPFLSEDLTQCCGCDDAGVDG
jgi:hypothetical protein